MAKVTLTSKQFLVPLATIHWAMFVSPLLFAGVIFVLNQTGNGIPPETGLAEMFKFVVPGFAIGAGLGSFGISKKLFANAANQDTLAKKLQGYQGASLVRTAMIETPALFACVAYLLTGEVLFLGIVAVMAVLMLLNRPSVEKIIKDLSLPWNEQEILTNPAAILGEFERSEGD